MATSVDKTNVESKIAQLRVTYAPHEKAYAELKERIDMAIQYGYSGGCVLSGDTGTGKSTLMTRAKNEFKRTETAEGSRIPLIYCQLTSKPTLIGILKSLLAVYGVPIKHRTTEQQLFALFKAQVAECGTRVVILDDVQHFVEGGRRVSINTAADDMKVLIDLGVLLIFSGMPNLEEIFKVNTQLRRRFLHRIYLRHLELSEASMAVIKSTANSLLAESESGLTIDSLDSEHWVKVHFATNGNISYINTLIAATAAVAIRNHRTKICQKDFAEAFETRIFPAASKKNNPFSSQFECRTLNESGEPFEGMEMVA